VLAFSDPRGVLAAATLVALAGCGAAHEDGGPDGAPDGDADPAADADRREDADGDGGSTEPDEEATPDPGPMTLVAAEVALVDERACDLDGDGVGDNAIAGLGASDRAFWAAAATSLMQGYVEEGWRLTFHLPAVDDRAGPQDPDTLLVTFSGVDLEDPPNAADDFSGIEPFWIPGTQLDACGEPLCSFRSARIEAGELRASGGVAELTFPGLYARAAQVTGRIDPGGTGAELSVCGYLRIQDLGRTQTPGGPDDPTMLELFVAGGAGFGVPSIPGLSPDIDVDGDGLERLLVDATNRIVTCIDGDGTPAEGSDCWQDDAMADAFSLTGRITAVGASFAGRQPGWEGLVVGTCDDPPDASVLDPP